MSVTRGRQPSLGRAGLVPGAPERSGGGALRESDAVTDVLRSRQRPTPPGPAAGRPSVVVHGALAALAAAVSGLAVLAAVVLVAWVADARSGSSGADAVRAAADAWLLAHGGGLRLPAGRIAGLPL